MRPIFIDSRIRRVFERQIVRAYESPTLFHPELLPMKRLFLFYGQPGSGLEDAIHALLTEYKVMYDEINVGRNPTPVKEALQVVKNPPVPVLWIRNGHLLQYHRELFLQTLDLAETTITSHLFIIVTGEEIPDEAHPFYQQFDARVPMGLPKKDHFRALMEYYFTAWQAHWKHSKMLLGADDLDWLSICCDYCTPGDVEKFVHKVFSHVADQFPEQRIDITRELLEDKNNLFMYESLGVAGILCITNRDGQKEQLKFDPEGAVDAKGLEEACERETKRAKVDQ